MEIIMKFKDYINEVKSEKDISEYDEWDAVDKLKELYWQKEEYTEKDIKLAKKLVKITGRRYSIFFEESRYRTTAGGILDNISHVYLEQQIKSGNGKFSPKASTTKDLARRIALFTNGEYVYHLPTTWVDTWQRKHRDPSDFSEYKDKKELKNAENFILKYSKVFNYVDNLEIEHTAYEMGKFLIEIDTYKNRLSVRTMASMKGETRNKL